MESLLSVRQGTSATIHHMEITPLLLWCGIIAGPLFIAVFLVEGALRDNYQPRRQPVSTLAIGKRGWIQRANFWITGILALAYAFGLPAALLAYDGSFWLPLLMGIYAAGLLGAGVFVTDITGLPKDSGALAVKRPLSGVLHDAFSLPVFAALPAAAFVFAHLFLSTGEAGWAGYSIISGIVFILGFMGAGRGFSGDPKLAPIAGLLQRLTLTIGWIWLSLVAAHLLSTLS
jgi:hypothetical protein